MAKMLKVDHNIFSGKIMKEEKFSKKKVLNKEEIVKTSFTIKIYNTAHNSRAARKEKIQIKMLNKLQ